VEFTSKRLILRSLHERDEELFCQLFCDPAVMRHIGPAWTRAAAVRALCSALEAMRSTPPRGLFLVLTLRAGERPAGLCTLQNFQSSERRAELGLMLVPSARAFGVATEALIASWRMPSPHCRSMRSGCDSPTTTKPLCARL
jgi:RimJ/RimL family protein N-acetyltransferase